LPYLSIYRRSAALTTALNPMVPQPEQQLNLMFRDPAICLYIIKRRAARRSSRLNVGIFQSVVLLTHTKFDDTSQDERFFLSQR
jgi:hypothetical protein